jgi:hypothetical protein
MPERRGNAVVPIRFVRLGQLGIRHNDPPLCVRPQSCPRTMLICAGGGPARLPPRLSLGERHLLRDLALAIYRGVSSTHFSSSRLVESAEIVVREKSTAVPLYRTPSSAPSGPEGVVLRATPGCCRSPMACANRADHRPRIEKPSSSSRGRR